jgi:membrane associated rhomboid family serine protease
MQNETKIEFQKFLYAGLVPVATLALMFLLKIIETSLEVNFYSMGVLPRTFHGLFGVLTSPFIHGSWQHLLNNSIPWLVLGTMLIYFHRKIAGELFFAMYFFSGIWLWIFGRNTYHIGASGIIYAMAAFHVTYGFVLKRREMLAISFLVVLLYGSMIWFLLPIDPQISWEAHICGALSGLLLGYYFAKIDKKQAKNLNAPPINYTYTQHDGEPIEFVYHFKEEKSDEQK